MSYRCLLTFGLLLVLVAAPLVAQEPTTLKESTVGMPVRLMGIVLPGPELEAKPIVDRKTPVVLRVVKTYPHGTDFRYDLEAYALDPGTYDLRDFLRRKDGQPLTGLPKLPLTANPIRPPGQVQPNQLVIEDGPRVGGYRWIMWAAIAFWSLGLLGIVAWMLSPLLRSRSAGPVERPQSLADRLRPLVQGAIDGQLTQDELAKLERGLLAFWRKRLNVETIDPSTAMARLRAHAEAGPLLGQLETWLHKPGPPAPVDVTALLAPYRDLPPESLELEEAK